MCDEDCRKRFERIELKVNQTANDMLWIRWLLRTAVVAGGLAFGVDLTGVV